MMFLLSRKERDDHRRTEHLKNVMTISSNELEFSDTLGFGGYGNVLKVQYRNETFAFKYPHGIKGPISEDDILAFQDEAAKQWSLRHENIVHLHAIVNEPNNFGLVMEYLVNGDMKKYIMNSEVPVPAEDVCLLIQDVSEGMQYLHAQPTPIIHGDLKIENVLISNEGRAKITDFGLSFWKDYSKKHSVNDVVSGTLRNIPPEYLEGRTLRKEEKFDVYGFGVFMWESIMKQTAFEGGNNAMIPVWVQNGQRPSLNEFPEDYPLSLKDLIKKCWDMKPNARPSFFEIRRQLNQNVPGGSLDDVDMVDGNRLNSNAESASRQNVSSLLKKKPKMPNARPLFFNICQQLARILNQKVPEESLDDVDMVDGNRLNSNAESASRQNVEAKLSGADIEIIGNSSPFVRGDETDAQHIEKALQDISCRTEKKELWLNTNEGQFEISKYLSATHKVWGPVTYKPTIFPRNVDHGKNLTYFFCEINIHLKLSHPNILKFIGIVYEPRDCGLIFEQIHFGTMKHFIQCFPTMSSPEKLRILKDVSVGLSYLHSLKPPIIHCWVKTESVYVDDENRVKLSDFQFAQEKTKDAKLDISRFVVNEKPATYHIPAEYFKNPELHLSEAIDTYGFAWMIVEVLNTVDVIKIQQEFYPDKKIFEIVSFGLKPCRFPNDVSRELTGVVNSCFDKEKDNWPSIADIRTWL